MPENSPSPLSAIDPAAAFHLLMENVVGYAIFFTDPDCRVISWNSGAERVLYFTEAEILGQSSDILFTPEDRKRGAPDEERRDALRTGRAEDERWHVRKDGSRFRGSGIMTALRDEAGNLRGFAKILRDDTPRQEAQEKEKERLQQRAAERERGRIAQDLHDSLSQGLVGITLQLEAAKDILFDEPEQAQAHIVRSLTLARDSLAEARRSVRAMRSPLLDNADLPTALGHLIHEMTTGISTPAKMESRGTAFPLSPEAEDALLRCGQEALTNALKHAQAREIKLTLTYGPQEVSLCVEDDGQGFDPSASLLRGGLGLLGIRERAERIGGTVAAVSAAGAGTRICISAPVAA